MFKAIKQFLISMFQITIVRDHFVCQGEQIKYFMIIWNGYSTTFSYTGKLYKLSCCKDKSNNIKTFHIRNILRKENG